MSGSSTAIEADWLGLCRRAAESLALMLDGVPTTAERAAETGTRGEGGDHTLMIDESAEDIVFAALQQLHDDGLRFAAVSEERGEVDFGGGAVKVVIDPIDGSLNAKRRLSPYALSIAVADGPTMADVRFGYVYDFGAGEEWWAGSGMGAFLDDRSLDPSLGERRARDGRLELLAIESADPRWLVGTATELAGRAHRLRALGALAPALCQVAAARFDALLSLRNCRAVDVAAAQLIVREAGGHVTFPAFGEPLGAPLDIAPHSPVVAARSADTLADLAGIGR
jgi:myo-inositol-1(or 4)-monophosphatase